MLDRAKRQVEALRSTADLLERESMAHFSTVDFLAVADLIESLIARLESAQPNWISVDDPPKTSGRCLVLFEDGHCCDAEFDENIDFDSKFGEWFACYDMDTLGFVDSEWRGYQEITHWMPLPKSPKEVT